jgi:hypothetical protein
MYLVRTNFPEYVLGTYWYVLCLQKYFSRCCFVLYACGKRYYVCVTCMLWCSDTELCPFWCPTYMTLFWYIPSTYWYVPVCTDIDFLYQSVLSMYLYVLILNQYKLNTLFLQCMSRFQMMIHDVNTRFE